MFVLKQNHFPYFPNLAVYFPLGPSFLRAEYAYASTAKEGKVVPVVRDVGDLLISNHPVVESLITLLTVSDVLHPCVAHNRAGPKFSSIHENSSF